MSSIVDYNTNDCNGHDDEHQDHGSKLDRQTTTKQRRTIDQRSKRNSSTDSSELSDTFDPQQLNDHSPMMMAEMSSDHSPKSPGSPSQDGLVIINRKNYDRLYYFTQMLGILTFILILIWLSRYLGGIGFESPAQTFNFHPLFMFLGFIVIYSNAALIYRSFCSELKQKLKLFHAIMNGVVMIISLFGSVAAIYFHHEANITHFYSLHSWLGISTWFMFIAQFSSGFVCFMFPGASFTIRKTLMPYHRFFGVATFTLAAATCLTGLNEKAIFAFKNPTYSEMAANGILTNVIGLLLSLYCVMIVYLLSKSEYQRRPLPEEQSGRK